MRKLGLAITWQLIVRFAVGSYWLFFSYQKWYDRTAIEELVRKSAIGNNLPVYGSLLRNFVVPNLEFSTVLIAIIEATLGASILLGLGLKGLSIVGAIMDLNLFLIFGPSSNDLPLTFWFYFAPLILNVQLFFDTSHEKASLQALFAKNKSRQKET